MRLAALASETTAPVAAIAIVRYMEISAEFSSGTPMASRFSAVTNIGANDENTAAPAATLPVQTQRGVLILRMTAIRKGEKVYRFLGLQPQGANQIGRRMDAAAASFRNLTAAQARRLKPSRLTIYKVRRGDTMPKVARRMPFDKFLQNRLRALNGIPNNEGLKVGQRIKLVLR